MTMEDRIRTMIGDLVLQNATLATQLEQAQARIAELEKRLADFEPEKPAKPTIVPGGKTA